MSGNTPVEGDVVAKFKEGVRQLDVSEAIRAAMKKLGLRNQDLVDICGTRARASEIVNGKRAVPKSMAVALARRLRIPVAKLLG